MLAAARPPPQAAELIDTALLIAGTACLLGGLAWLIRSGAWRNPLAGVRPADRGPGLYHVLLALVVYVGLSLLFYALLAPPPLRQQPVIAGSHRWYLAQTADGLARLAAVVLIAAMLRQIRPRAAPTRLSRLRLAAAGVLVGLILLPVCTAQFHMTAVLWRWLHPEWVSPLHPVIDALKENAWGQWGKVHLLVGAAVIAPLAEEFLFRGLVLPGIWGRLRHAWLAVLASALAFGLIHFNQPDAVLPLCTMGVLLGYLRLRTASLLPCIVAHAVFNTRTMLLALFFPELLTQP